MTPQRSLRWPVLQSRQVYRNPWLAVREDRVLRPDGSRGRYGVIEVGDAVSIVALSDKAVCLVRQYRHAWSRDVWEVPCGGLHKGERPLAAARRELREEAGITARRWDRLGIIRANDPIVNTFHLYLARTLRIGPPAREGSEADMVSRMWPLAEYRWAVISGAVSDDMTIACIAKALLWAGIRL
jgi:8-oxo-dGTP pyrophosphatase MutT (NUDIX family)